MSQGIRIGSSNALNPVDAIQEIYEQVKQEHIALVVLFISVEYNQQQLTSAIHRNFSNIPVIGCTTSGEIGPTGYMNNGISGFSLSTQHFFISATQFAHLQNLSIRDWQKETSDLYYQHAERQEQNSNTFALLLVDGLSVREEPLTRAIYNAIPDIPLIGGSAGDNLHFKQTFVYFNRTFSSDSAVLALVSTDFPFKTFYTQHFLRSEKRMVVTEADPTRRIVSEINGLPAAQEYARMVGLEIGELTSMIFAAHPVVVKIGGHEYVRSIQKVNQDDSLTFYCAIDIGIVLSVARGIDIVENLEDTLQQIENEIGRPQLTLTCDCILRSLELDQIDQKNQVSDILTRYRSIGFSTYGEQYNGVHVNQTLTAIAIGDAVDRPG